VAGNDSVAGSDSAAGNGDVKVPLLQCPELVALPSQEGSVSTALKAHLRIGTWVAQRQQAMSPLVQPGLHSFYLFSVVHIKALKPVYFSYTVIMFK